MELPLKRYPIQVELNDSMECYKQPVTCQLMLMTTLSDWRMKKADTTGAAKSVKQTHHVGSS